MAAKANKGGAAKGGKSSKNKPSDAAAIAAAAAATAKANSASAKDYVAPTPKSILGGLIDDEMDELGGGDQEADVEQLLNMSDFALSVDNFAVARLSRFDANEKVHVVVCYDTDFFRSQARNQLDDESADQVSRRRWLDERGFDDEGNLEDDARIDDEEDDDAVNRASGRIDLTTLDPRGRFARDIVRRSNAIDEIEDEEDEDEDGVARGGEETDDIYVFDRVFGVHIVKPGHSEMLLSCVAACDGSYLIRTIVTNELAVQKGDADGVAPALPPSDFINDSAGVPFFEMSRELQEALREWFATLGVDDSVSTFIQEYIETRKCREQSQTLSILKNMVLNKSK